MWTKEQERAARARLEIISPYPWMENDDGGIESANCGGVANVVHHGNVNTIARTGELFSSADAAFIAAAPTDLAAALAEIDRLRAALRRIVDDYGKLSVELPHIIARAALSE